MRIANRYDNATTTKMLISEGIEDHELETEDRFDAKILLDYLKDGLNDVGITPAARQKLTEAIFDIEYNLTAQTTPVA